MNGDKVLKLSTTHSDDDALNKAKTLIKDVIAGQEHVLFTDLDEPENDTEYTLEYSDALSNKILDEIKKPQYTNQLILTEVIVDVEDDGISTYEKATRTLAAPPGFDDTSADYDTILNELNSSSQAKPKKRRKKKKDPFNLGSKSDDIGDQISELSDYQEKQNDENTKSDEPDEVSQSDQSTSDEEENDKNENDLVQELVNSLVPSKNDITEKLNSNLDVEADDDTKSFGNTHASSLLAVYNIAKPHIRKIEKEDLDSQLEDFKREIASQPPSVINDLIEANDKRVQFANEVHDQTEHIRNERENQRQEYVDAKLKEVEEQIRNQFEYEYPGNTEDKISEYLQSVKDDLDQYSANFDNKRSEAHSQLMEEFKKRQDDDSLNEVFDFLEQKATISGYAQNDIDNAYKRQGLYDLEEEDDDDFDFDDDFATNESPNTNDNEQIEQNQQTSDKDDGIVDIDKMMAQQTNEYTDDLDESEPSINQDNSDASQTKNDDESDFEDEDDPFGDAFEEDEPADENESLPEDNDIFDDDDPILNEEVNEDTQDEDTQDEDDYPNPNSGDEFIEPQSEYQTNDDDEDDLLTEDVDKDKEIDNNIITASRANSTLSDDIENDKTQMADDYESTTLQDEGNDKADNEEKESTSKDNKKNKKKDKNKTPSAIEILKLDKISKKTRKLIMIILASVIILAGIGAVTTSIIISNNDAHQDTQKKEEQKKEQAKKQRLDEIAKYMKGKKMQVVDKESQNRVVFTVTDITEKGGAKGHYYKTDDGDREKVEKYMSPEVVKDYVDRLKKQEKEKED